ncbi:MAG: hypothetical protein AAB019_08135 [Planctomycetota bacterium]
MTDKKEKILILFEGPHLAYSPTVTQLYDELSKNYEVTIVAQHPEDFTNQELNRQNIVYYKYKHGPVRYFYRVLFEILTRISQKVKYPYNHKITYQEYFFRIPLIRRLCGSNDYKRIVSVDSRNLFFVSVLKIKSDFLSLEIRDEKLLLSVDTKLINCVIIQNKARYDYLFQNKILKTFFVQNAPNFEKKKLKETRKGLIFAGTAWTAFGFYHCLNYINMYPEEILTVQGAMKNEDKETIKLKHSNLLKENRLIVNDKYLDNKDVVECISNFEIGFCFYDFDTDWINNFNYKTAPSGKLFKCLAAGVPVICNDIIGFDFVNEFKCGVLIKNLSETEIRNAVLQIRGNYQYYVTNATKAAMHFSFDKSIKPYLEYIKEN